MRYIILILVSTFCFACNQGEQGQEKQTSVVSQMLSVEETASSYLHKAGNSNITEERINMCDMAILKDPTFNSAYVEKAIVLAYVMDNIEGAMRCMDKAL